MPKVKESYAEEKKHKYIEEQFGINVAEYRKQSFAMILKSIKQS